MSENIKITVNGNELEAKSGELLIEWLVKSLEYIYQDFVGTKD